MSRQRRSKTVASRKHISVVTEVLALLSDSSASRRAIREKQAKPLLSDSPIADSK
jgi:hypothetical protein